MTAHLNALSGANYDILVTRFRPIFKRIADSVLAREQHRTLPFEPIQWLKEAGFGALRVPEEHGGFGVSLVQLTSLLIELAEADSNVAQALRGHFAFVEDRVNAHHHAPQDVWLKRFVAGELVGCAWTEVGAVKIGDRLTRISQLDEKWVVNGTKYYSTGSIFADWIDLLARRDDTGKDVTVAVFAKQPGIRQHDDWDGFGQRMTGSGTAIFENAEIELHNIIEYPDRFKYQTSFHQLILNAVLVGIGRAAVRDFSTEVFKRTRVYSHGNAAAASEDAQIQQVVGKASAQVYAAQASALLSAEANQQAYISHIEQNEEARRKANVKALVETSQAQITIVDLVLSATSNVFNALGASATSTGKQLDRHWRNARTVSSHNPVIYKERIIGDWEINGTEPPFVLQIGGGSKQV
ncbi:MAG TPA: monooxygenase [Gammaproteobacteria bacterium]|nr:monooxygenase [Gammaproteobacteria bacterium]